MRCPVECLTSLRLHVRQLIDIDDGFCTLMDDKGETRGDLRVPDGALGQQIQKDFDDGKEMLVSMVVMSLWALL